MSKKGRPRKDNAVKSGELGPGLQRFTFVAEKRTVKAIRQIAANADISIKDFMRNLLKPVHGEKVNEIVVVKNNADVPKKEKTKYKASFIDKVNLKIRKASSS
ncbi:MAG TPA: hypothetical protein VK489_05855 [Ferruginibacter sp.]|nr:hypothetical protein [Ferruginibacter sp.]